MGFFNLLKGIKYEKHLKVLVFLVPLSILLLPEIRIVQPHFRFEDIILLLLFILYFLKVLFVDKLRINFNIFDYIFLLLLVSTLFSITYSYMARGVPFSLSDFFEPLRIFRYYIFFRVLTGIKWTIKDYKIVIKVILVATIAVLLFAFMQYLNLFGINHLALHYSIPYHVDRVARLGRVIGTFRNPNNLGIFLSVPVILSFVGLFKALYRGKAKELAPWILLLFSSISIFSMTLARTSLVAVFCAVILVACTLFLVINKREKSNHLALSFFYLFLIFITSSVVSYLFVEALPRSNQRISFVNRVEIGWNELTGKEQDDGVYTYSWSGRMERWGYALSKIEESPLFGKGPSKSLRGEKGVIHVDNDYLNFAMKYGLMGLFLFITLYGLMLLESIKILFLEGGQKFLELRILSIGVVFSYILFNVLSGTFYNFQLFTLLLLIFGLNYSIRGDLYRGVSL